MDNSMLSEIYQSQKDKYCDSAYMFMESKSEVIDVTGKRREQWEVTNQRA